jgi:macrolide-specific efflux system membrane fusion protein
MKKKKWIWILILAAIIASGAWWKWKRNGDEKSAEQFEAIEVVRGNIEVTIQATGVVQPQNRVEIKPSVSGRMEEILVHEGDKIKEGQIVAWMSSTDRAALLDAARARGVETLAYWKDMYKPTPLVAPLDGTIISRLMEPGQTATPQDTVLAMSDTLIVEAQVDETDLAQLHLGQEVTVTLDAYPKENFPARVTHIAYEAETVNNVTIYKVEVMPKKMPDFVRSGMTANVMFTAVSAKEVLLVPAEAVSDENGTQTVRIPGSMDPKKPFSREVQTGLTDGKNIEIKDGLKEGARVLVTRMQMPTSTVGKAKSNPFVPFGRGGRPPRH